LRSRSGKRGAQVQAGPPTTIGTALRDQAVDLGVRQLRELAGAATRVDRKELQEAMLDRRCSAASAPRAGEDFEPGVELQRVRGQRHGWLAVRAQAVGDGEATAVSHPGRAEEGEDVRSLRLGHRPGVSSDMVSDRLGLSTDPDPRTGAIEAAQRARATLDGRRCDLALVSPQAPSRLARVDARGRRRGARPTAARRLRRRRRARGGREIEDGKRPVAVCGAALDERQRGVFTSRPSKDRTARPSSGCRREPEAIVLLPDPYSFPADAFVAELGDVPVLGGISIARTLDGSAALFCGNEVKPDGAVRVAFEGVDIHAPCRRAPPRWPGDDDHGR